MLWNYFKIEGEILAFLKYTSQKNATGKSNMIERLEIVEKASLFSSISKEM